MSRRFRPSGHFLFSPIIINEVFPDYVHTVEITSGQVPGNTAVILECSGTDPVGNRLLPLDSEPAAIGTNYLIGVYFNSEGYQTSYDRSTMRVFSIKKGVLGFYKWSGTILGANKAFLDVSSISEAKEYGNFTIEFSSDITDAVETGETELPDEQREDDAFYDLSGRKSLHPGRGIYIHKGKKVYIR